MIALLIFYWIFSILVCFGTAEFGNENIATLIVEIILIILLAPILFPYSLGTKLGNK